MKKINSWDEFQPLEELVVGGLYDASFFDGVKNATIRSALTRIVEETHEDIENFVATMTSHGVDVRRLVPKELGYKDSILDYVDVNGALGHNKGIGEDNFDIAGIAPTLIPNPPLQPRDDLIVMGDRILVTDPGTYATQRMLPKIIEWYGAANVDMTVHDRHVTFRRTEENMRSFLKRKNLVADPSALSAQELEAFYEQHPLYCFCSPNITRIGKKALVDIWQTPQIVDKFLGVYYPHFNYEEIYIGGHNDSVFSVVKPGLVIASKDLKEYEHVFKDWQILYFDDPNWSQVKKWQRLKSKNKGKWWVPGQEENDEFTSFVEQWLGGWTGYVEETIFDVNCLVVDDKYVVVNTPNPTLLDLLKANGMEGIVCPLRHRFFFDGGWHCLTLDIRRRGAQTDYGL